MSFSNIAKIVAIIYLTIVLGCTRHYHIESAIPPPVMDPLPLSVALSYTKPFLEYEYQKESPDGSTYIVKVAPAQEKLFDQLFNKLFNKVTKTNNIQEATNLQPSADMIVELSIDDYAVATPKDNGLDFYEVTIRYRLSLYGPDGALINAWFFNGYGRDRKKEFTPFDSVPVATKEAMRDAATLIAVEFKTAKEVEFIVCQKSADSTACAR